MPIMWSQIGEEEGIHYWIRMQINERCQQASIIVALLLKNKDFMFFENINRKALVSFIIFCIVLAKDILVSDLKIIPVRSPLNRTI